MRRPQRLIATAVLIALSGALAGCGSTAGFDPSDLLDFLDTKKKLPGDRKPVFPEGVPGLEQGVPKDLYRGARQQDDPNAQAAAAPPPVEEPKAKRGAKSKGKQAAAPAGRGSRRRARGGRRHRRRAAGAQAGQDRAQAHHRAAGRSVGRTCSNPRSRRRCRAVRSRADFFFIAFSSEVEAGSREENASKIIGSPLQFWFQN